MANVMGILDSVLRCRLLLLELSIVLITLHFPLYLSLSYYVPFVWMTLDVTRYLYIKPLVFWLLAFLVEKSSSMRFGRKRFKQCCFLFVTLLFFYILLDLCLIWKLQTVTALCLLFVPSSKQTEHSFCFHICYM